MSFEDVGGKKLDDRKGEIFRGWIKSDQKGLKVKKCEHIYGQDSPNKGLEMSLNQAVLYL